MISLICFLVAAAIFACAGVRAENNGQYFKTGVCVAGCVASLLWACVAVLLRLVAEGWQP